MSELFDCAIAEVDDQLGDLRNIREALFHLKAGKEVPERIRQYRDPAIHRLKNAHGWLQWHSDQPAHVRRVWEDVRRAWDDDKKPASGGKEEASGDQPAAAEKKPASGGKEEASGGQPAAAKKELVLGPKVKYPYPPGVENVRKVEVREGEEKISGDLSRRHCCPLDRMVAHRRNDIGYPLYKFPSGCIFCDLLFDPPQARGTLASAAAASGASGAASGPSGAASGASASGPASGGSGGQRPA